MRVLHTSDWHLGSKLFHHDRQPDLRARLQEIAVHLKEHKVDVMVVAGDLFHKKHHRTEELQQAMGDLRETFLPFLRGGGTIVAISGNHDNEALLDLLNKTQDLAAPVDTSVPGPRPSGRLYLAPQPGVLRLADRDGQQLQILLLPYPTPERYLRGEETAYESREAKNASLQRGLIRHLERLRDKADPRLPSVLLAHAHVRGGQLHNLYEIELKDDVVFDPTHLPGNYAYTAYGHIHKPQLIGGAENVRYCGSIERMNKDEHEDHKSVVIFDVNGGDPVRPATLPLSATPLLREVIHSPEIDLPRLAACPERERAILYYTLALPVDANRAAVVQELERLYPRSVREVAAVSDGERDSPVAAARGQAALNTRLADVSGTVTDYLEERLRDHPRRDEAITLARRLLAREARS